MGHLRLDVLNARIRVVFLGGRVIVVEVRRAVDMSVGR